MNQVNKCSMNQSSRLVKDCVTWLVTPNCDMIMNPWEKSAATLLLATKYLHHQLGRRIVHASVTLNALNARTTELHPLG